MTALSSKLTRGTVPLSNLPERTVWVDENVVSVSNSNGGTVRRADFQCFKDANNNYSIYYSIFIDGATGSGGHVITLGLGGAVFKTGYDEAGTAGVGVGRIAYTLQGTSNIQAVNGGSDATIVIAGFGQLDGKPSWFDANREAGFSINAQVEETTPTTAGLAPARSSLISYMSGTGTAQGNVIPFDTPYESVGSGFSNNGSGLFTVSFTGHVMVQLMFHTAGVPGNGQLYLRKNGSNYLSATNMNANSNVNQPYSFSLSVSAGDTIDFIYDGSGTTYQYGVAPSGGGSTYVSFVRIA
jgi:hypothetical protein